MTTAHVFISGFVQGIGFRQWIKRSAERTGVRGWVRNLRDGRVEAVLQGRIEDVKKIILICRKGPFLSEIKRVDVEWEDSEEIFEFFETIV